MVRKPILYIVPGFSAAAGGKDSQECERDQRRGGLSDIINPGRASQSFAYPPGHAPSRIKPW